MASSSNRRPSKRGNAVARQGIDPARNPSRPLSVDELIAERNTPPLTVKQLAEKWAGVFEAEFWEEVRRGARSR